MRLTDRLVCLADHPGRLAGRPVRLTDLSVRWADRTARSADRPVLRLALQWLIFIYDAILSFLARTTAV